MDLRWQLIASLLRRGSQSINLGQGLKKLHMLNLLFRKMAPLNNWHSSVAPPCDDDDNQSG